MEDGWGNEKNDVGNEKGESNITSSSSLLCLISHLFAVKAGFF